MAYVSTDNAGRHRVFYFDAKGKRQTLRLGRMALKDAEKASKHVAHIVNAQIKREPEPRETAEWLSEIDEKLRVKLTVRGLTFQRPKPKANPLTSIPEDVTTKAAAFVAYMAAWLAKLQAAGIDSRKADMLGPFLYDYLAKRAAAKPWTLSSYLGAARSLRDYFNDDKPLNEITIADASDWRRWMLTAKLPKKQGRAGTNGLGENTVRRRCGFARQFFAEAVDARLLTENPFRKLKDIGVKANRSRDYFLTRADADRIIEACPDAEWRLIFSLSRFGGLRCPSEHLALTWGGVNWVQGRLTIPVPKLEHLGDDYATREIPLFPELRPYLEDAWALAAARVGGPVPAAAPIVIRYRDANANLRTQLNRIVRRAGLSPWPKLFHNLRATRQTELEEDWPSHVVCRWIGNSQAVARKHYLQVTDAHFEAAASKVAQKVAHSQAVSGAQRTSGVTAITKTAEKCDISADSKANQCSLMDSNHEPTD